MNSTSKMIKHGLIMAMIVGGTVGLLLFLHAEFKINVLVMLFIGLIIGLGL